MFSTQDIIDIIKPIDVDAVDKFVIVASSSTEKIEEFLRKHNAKYDIVAVREDFEEIADKIAEYIAKRSEKEEELLVNLINVQPLFVIASLSAFLLAKTDAEIVFSHYSVRVKEMMPPSKINKKHVRILRILGEQPLTITDISEKSGLPLATAWRRLSDLINDEIVTKEDFKLTRKGRVVKVILTTDEHV